MATEGVLGGMGAMATAVFNTMLINAQIVEKEQDYLDVITYSKTSIPDRTTFILGQSKNDPTAEIVDAAVALEQAGADFIAIPCVTVHYFYNAIAKAVTIPVINILKEIAAYIQAHSIKNLGVLATDGTLQTGILHSVFKPLNVNIITPEPSQQATLMKMIYHIKQGQKVLGSDFERLEDTLFAKDAEVVLLGCTELGFIKSDRVEKRVDVLDILVKAVLKFGMSY